MWDQVWASCAIMRVHVLACVCMSDHVWARASVRAQTCAGVRKRIQTGISMPNLSITSNVCEQVRVCAVFGCEHVYACVIMAEAHGSHAWWSAPPHAAGRLRMVL